MPNTLYAFQVTLDLEKTKWLFHIFYEVSKYNVMAKGSIVL